MIKIISGGQTGADLGGLWAAKWYGLPTGGTAPKYFKTLEGSKPSLNMMFGVTESHSSNYTVRTLQNVQDSDMTWVFAENFNSPGTRLTIKNVINENKPHFNFHKHSSNTDTATIQTVDAIFARLHAAQLLGRDTVINIAGNASTNAPGIFRFTFLRCLFLFDLMFVKGIIPRRADRSGVLDNLHLKGDSVVADYLTDNYDELKI